MLTLLFLLWSLIRGLKKSTQTSQTSQSCCTPVEGGTTTPPEEPTPTPSPDPTCSPSPEPEIVSEMSSRRISSDNYRSRYTGCHITNGPSVIHIFSKKAIVQQVKNVMLYVQTLSETNRKK